MKIVVDHRESRSEVFLALQRAPGVEIEVQELSCGDYLLREDFAVERKSASDFILSIQNRRLFAQAARLAVEFPRRAFLIEGNVLTTRSAMAPEAIIGAVSYLTAIEGAAVLQVANAAEAVRYVLTMTRHLQQGLGYEVALRGAKPKQSADLAQYVVEGLPGIGPSTAKALLRHFGSAAAVFDASTEQLCAVPGVGKKTAERARDALMWSYPPN
jgi:fanconi anemia group M protein